MWAIHREKWKHRVCIHLIRLGLPAKTDLRRGTQISLLGQNVQGLFRHVKTQGNIGNFSRRARVNPFLRDVALDVCFGILIFYFDDANLKCCILCGTFLGILYLVTYFHFPLMCPWNLNNLDFSGLFLEKDLVKTETGIVYRYWRYHGGMERCLHLIYLQDIFLKFSLNSW